MTLIDILLKANSTDEFILKELSTQICPYQMEFLPKVCVGFVYLYGPYALPVLAQEEYPIKVCDALNVC